MTDSSPNSEDKIVDLLREASDTSLINDDLFNEGLKEAHKQPKMSNDEPKQSTSKEFIELKSERYLEFTEHHNDFDISQSIRDLVYKRLSQNIDKVVEYVTVDNNKKLKKKNKKEKYIVKLLSDTEPISHIGEISMKDNFDVPTIIRKKPEIKRRLIVDNEYSDDEKWKTVAIDGNTILNGSETKQWKPKRVSSAKFFEYRERNGIMYLKDPENEFTAKRKKNNWVESKISKWKKQ